MAGADDILNIIGQQSQAAQSGADGILSIIGAKPQAPLTGAAYYRDANQKFLAQHPEAQQPSFLEGLGRFGAAALGGIAGIAGDLEQFANGGAGQHLPTSADITHALAGQPQTGTDRAIELGGNLISPTLAGDVANGLRAVTAPLRAATVPADVRAGNLLTRALSRDNVSPQNAADTIAQFGSKPTAIMDVGGNATARLARTVNTLPGEGSTQVSNFLAERQADQGGRVIGDISQNLAPGGDVYGQAKQIMVQRAAAAKPAYDAAFEGGSIAPLQDQLRASVQQATAQKGAVQRQITAIEQNNPGALAARGAAGADTRAQYMDLHRQLQQAEADRQATLKMFQTAQSDAASNAPGAVWSPRLQQFLDQPEVQQGIQRGLKIQRLESVGNGEPFNPTEYGITGTDADGKAIVSNVPNMRLLDAGKRGLDAMIADNTDAVTGKVNDLGRALTIAKNGYVSELDKLNPLYKAARDAYAGSSASLNALRDGGSFLAMSPEELADRISNMSQSEQQFFRMGASRALQDRVNGGADNADAVKRVFGNKTIRSQISSVFGQNAADQFAQAMTPEKIGTMTNQFVRGGSNTANKLADVSDTGTQIMQDAAIGGMQGGLHGAIARPLINQGWAHIKAFFNGMSPEVRAQLGNLLTQTGPEAQASLLRLPNAAKVAAPVGNAGVRDILSSPMLRAILARQAVTLPPMLFGAQPGQK